MVTRKAHNLEITGSNPVSAITYLTFQLLILILLTETSTIPLTVGTLYLRDNVVNAGKIFAIVSRGLDELQMKASLFTVDKAVIR